MNAFLAFQFYISSMFFFGRIMPFHRAIWLVLPAASLAAALLLFFYHRYQNRHQLNRVILTLSGLMSAGIFILSLYCFTQFIHICVLPQVSPWIFAACFGVLCVSGCLVQFGTLERFASLSGPVVIALLFLADLSGLLKIRFSGSFGFATFDNYFIVPSHQLWATFLFLFMIYLSEGVILINSIALNKKAPWPYRNTVKGQLFSTLAVSITYLITIAALGPFVFEQLTYPIYYPAGLSWTAEYLDRIEVILITVFCLTEYCKLSLLSNHIKTVALFISRKNSRSKE